MRLLYAQMNLFFKQVTISKPRSSRASSIEAFIVCIHYVPRDDYDSGFGVVGASDAQDNVVTAGNHLGSITSFVHSGGLSIPFTK